MEQVVDLATRKSGSIAVALVWDRGDETLRVFAYDGSTGEEIVVPVSGGAYSGEFIAFRLPMP